MAESTLTAVSQNGVTDLTEAEAKALHKKLNNYYRKRSGGKRKPKSVLKPRSAVTEHTRTISIESQPTDLDEIDKEPFSLTPNNVSELWIKVGAERIRCVSTGASKGVAAAQVYRVFM